MLSSKSAAGLLYSLTLYSIYPLLFLSCFTLRFFSKFVYKCVVRCRYFFVSTKSFPSLLPKGIYVVPTQFSIFLNEMNSSIILASICPSLCFPPTILFLSPRSRPFPALTQGGALAVVRGGRIWKWAVGAAGVIEGF